MTASLLDAAARVDLIMASDSATTVQLNFEDSDGASIDFTGSTFSLVVKARDANNAPTGSAVLTLTTGSGIAGTVASGEVIPTFPKAASSGLAVGSYIYEIRRLVAAASIEVVAVGLIDVVAGLS